MQVGVEEMGRHGAPDRPAEGDASGLVGALFGRLPVRANTVGSRSWPPTETARGRSRSESDENRTRWRQFAAWTTMTASRGRPGESVEYDAFISYSHAADGRLAPAVQTGLQRLAKSWWRIRALRIFRDETGLSVNPDLWRSIEAALRSSQWFVLFCSPEAATSPWVNKEIETWIETMPPERILPVLTSGTFEWDAELRDFSQDSNAVPPTLRGQYGEMPHYLDLRWARSETQLDLRNSRFRGAIATIAAPIHGVTRDELDDEDVRVYRRARRLAQAGVALLVVLVCIASALGAWALSEQRAIKAELNAKLACLAVADAARVGSAVHYANTGGQWPRSLTAMTGGKYPEFTAPQAAIVEAHRIVSAKWTLTMSGGGAIDPTFECVQPINP